MISADILIFQIRSMVAGYGELDKNGSWLRRIRWGDLGSSQNGEIFWMLNK